MPKIAAVSHALPEHGYAQEEIARVVAGLFAGPVTDQEQLQQVFTNARIKQRHLVMPLDWYRTPCTAAERNRLYQEHGLELLSRAAGGCLSSLDWPHDRVDQIICVSTTGHATPSLDAHLINHLGLRRETSRLPIWSRMCRRCRRAGARV